MATEVIMPQMGESIAEGTITKWLVKVGDTVQRDQPLFEISTDKVDAEIPSPASGVLLGIRALEGETVAVDAVVGTIGEGGEQPVVTPPAADTAAASPPPGDVQASATDAETVAPQGEGAEYERIRRFSSPVVRKIAAEHGVRIEEITGSGIHGRVTKQDIEDYLAQRHAAPGVAPTAPEVPSTPSAAAAAAVARSPRPMTASVRQMPGDFYVPPYTEGENVEIEPMSRIRQITAAHMAYSKATSAHVTTVFHMDLARVARARARAKERFFKEHGTKLTFMPFIFRAVASGLKAHPKINAAIDGTNVVFKKDINIGMAVALDWGLLVPVIQDADRLSLIGLAKSASDLAERARAKKLMPEELQGGTFTVTNPGVFGSMFGTPIINQPQVAILGVGAIEKRPVVSEDAEGNDTIVIKPMSYFAITYDHRLVDGADADHFMNHVKRTLVEETWSELDAFL